MNSNDFALIQTADFVLASLNPCSRVLEIGCGNGDLACHLIEHGHEVLALDTDADAIEKAAKRGVEAKQIDFIHFKTQEKFDAVVCSRSFHHIHPTKDAVEKAALLLKPGGKLILEEFAYERLDQNSAVWYFGLYSLLQAENPERRIHGPKLESEQIPQDPLSIWLEHGSKKHHVAESSHMRELIIEKFKLEFEEQLPYLYRYFTDFLTAAGSEKLMEWERRLIETGVLKAVGWRLTASKPL